MTEQEIRRMVHRVDEVSDQVQSPDMFEALMGLREELLEGRGKIGEVLSPRFQSLTDALCEAAREEDRMRFDARFSDLAAAPGLDLIREPVKEGARELRQRCESQAEGIRLTARLRRIQRGLIRNRTEEEKEEMEARAWAEDRMAAEGMNRLIRLYRFRGTAEVREMELERQRRTDRIREEAEIGRTAEEGDELRAREAWMEERLQNVEHFLDDRRIFSEKTGLSDCTEGRNGHEKWYREADRNPAAAGTGEGDPAADCLSREHEAD